MTELGQNMFKLKEIVAGKFKVEVVNVKNLELVKKEHPELHISLESRAKNVIRINHKAYEKLIISNKLGGIDLNGNKLNWIIGTYDQVPLKKKN